MHAIDVVLVIGWIAFWIGWMVAATQAKSGRSALGRFVGFRLAIIVVVIALERVPAFRGQANHDVALGVVGLVLVFAGLAIAVWARVHLGRNWGMPMSEKIDPELVVTGPYRWIRNPIYSGILLAAVGTAVAVNIGLLVVTAVIGAYFVYSAVVEQRLMAAHFPATYPDYRRSTKMLIPYVF
jgi:protein-S-isoprenylcysteine O-methyltransferase Ste14